MAKAPNKPVKTNKEAAPAKAKPPRTKARQAALDQESEATYLGNKEAIDTALRRCTSHLKQLDPEVAREVIRRLKDYYLTHGIKPGLGGFRLG